MGNSERDFDLFVIGGGSGGVRAARIASGHHARVGLAEEYRMGGTCVIRGCIPKKLLVYASHLSEDMEAAEGFGWSILESRFDWTKMIANKDREIARLEGLYHSTLEKAGVTTFAQRATLEDAHTVRLDDGRTFSVDTVLICTGASPFMPEILGVEHAISSNEAFDLEDLPRHILIGGAGYIAVEFAGIFNGLGSQVSLSYRRDKVLRGFDEDIRDHLTGEMHKKGINFFFESTIEAILKKRDSLHVALSSGENLVVNQVMLATGRLPNTKGLGLRAVGVELKENGAVAVDDYSRTNIPNIFAVGDVTDRVALTPVAIKEGHAFALTQYGDNPVSPDHDNVPAAVFSQPPIGTVGLTEEAARNEFGDIDVYKSEFRPLKFTLGNSDERAFIKLIVDRGSDRVVGAHMVGPDAPEIIQGMAIAVKAGLTKKQFDSTVAIHPSSAEEFVLMREPVGGRGQ